MGLGYTTREETGQSTPNPGFSDWTLSRLSSVDHQLRFRGRHVCRTLLTHVATGDVPLLGLLDQQRGDESRDGGVVGKDAHHPGTPLIALFTRSSGLVLAIRDQCSSGTGRCWRGLEPLAPPTHSRELPVCHAKLLTSYANRGKPWATAPSHGSPIALADKFSPEMRSKVMAAVRQRDTVPEMYVRRMLHGMGYRYRLHRRDLPGSPDLVFPSRKKVVFVHGCFWHGHTCPKGALPKTRLDFWRTKIQKNRKRDARTLAQLQKIGWQAITVWQCELADRASLKHRLVRFLAE